MTFSELYQHVNDEIADVVKSEQIYNTSRNSATEADTLLTSIPSVYSEVNTAVNAGAAEHAQDTAWQNLKANKDQALLDREVFRAKTTALQRCFNKIEDFGAEAVQNALDSVTA